MWRKNLSYPTNGSETPQMRSCSLPETRIGCPHGWVSKTKTILISFRLKSTGCLGVGMTRDFTIDLAAGPEERRGIARGTGGRDLQCPGRRHDVPYEAIHYARDPPRSHVQLGSAARLHAGPGRIPRVLVKSRSSLTTNHRNNALACV